MSERHYDSNSSDDNKKVSLGANKTELKKMIPELMEQYIRLTSKIVLKESSASDLALATTALGEQSEFFKNVKEALTLSCDV